jgi:hypothetical protein
MEKIGSHTFDHLKGCDNIKSFAGAIRTYGAAIEFTCNRPKPSYVPPLTPSDIHDKVNLANATV